MALQVIEVSAHEKHAGRVAEIAQSGEALDVWDTGVQSDGRQVIRILAGQEHVQELIDSMQDVLDRENGWRINISHLEATIPKPAELKPVPGAKTVGRGTTTREEIYTLIEASTQVDADYLLFVLL